MLSAAVTSSAPFAVTNDSRGGTFPPFPSEPAKQKIGFSSGQGSTTTEDYKDKIKLSVSGVEQSQQVIALENESGKAADTTNGEKQVPTEVQAKTGIQKLTPAEEQMVQQLQNRDREVKTHEMAHLASAGQYARGAPSYSYQMGPDGQRYAIGGEVSIDISKERAPEQTMQKMEVVISAALAPAQPSPADRSIAAAAAAMQAQAQQEIQNERMDASQEQGQSRAESQTAGEQTLKNDTGARDSAYRIQPLDLVT